MKSLSNYSISNSSFDSFIRESIPQIFGTKHIWSLRFFQNTPYRLSFIATRIRKWLCLLLLLSLSIAIQAQNLETTGLTFDSSAYRAFPLLELKQEKNKVLPDQISLKKYCPFPKSQGVIASCVGWATGYGALTIFQAINCGITDRARITDNLAYSASFIYNQIKGNNTCEVNTTLTAALELLKEKGDCLTTTFPNSVNSCHQLPNTSAFQEAATYKVHSSARLFDHNDPSEIKIRATKTQLANANPVIVGMSKGPEYLPLIGKPYWDTKHVNENGHAMVVIGYDDRRKIFELMNSYGQKWGNQGFIHISYEDFGKLTAEAFVLADKSAGKGVLAMPTRVVEPVKTSVNFEILSPDPVSGALIPAALQFNPETINYELEKKDWLADKDRFRFAFQIPKGRYAHFVNIDSRGRAKAFWSMTAQSMDTLVHFPPKGFYQFPAGEENMVLLLSHEPILQLDNYIRLLAFETGSPMSCLQAVFKEHLMDPRTIHYQKQAGQYRGQCDNPTGIVVPVVLTIRLLEE